MGDTQRVDIHQKLSESEKLMKEMSQTWEEKLVKTGKYYDNDSGVTKHPVARPQTKS